MSALAERLEQAVQRGWANTAHLAELRDLLQRRAANDTAPAITVDDAMVARALSAWTNWFIDYTGKHDQAAMALAMTHALQAALEHTHG